MAGKIFDFTSFFLLGLDFLKIFWRGVCQFHEKYLIIMFFKGWLNLLLLGVSEPVLICLRLMYSLVMPVPVLELRLKLPRLKIKRWNQLEQ